MSAPAAVPLVSVLDLPAWRDGVRVLAGQPAGRVVTGTLLTLDRVRSCPGALVATLTAPADATTSWRLDAFLRRAADAGASAVLLPTTADLPTPTRLLCTRLDLCVLGSDADPLDLLAAAAVAVAAPDLRRAQTLLRVQSALATGRHSGSSELAALLTTALAVPVAVVDRHGQVLDGAGGIPGPRLDEPVPQRLPTPTGTALAHPVLLPGLSAPQRWLLAAVPAERADAVTTVADCLTVGAASLAGRLATDRLVLERSARARTGLLADVLRAGDHPTPELRRRATASGWPLDGWHVGLHVGAGPDVDTAGAREDVLATFDAAGVDVVLVEQGDGWGGWWTTPREPSAEQVQTLAHALRAAHRGLQSITRCSTGVGRPHPGTSGIAATLAEAADAARLAANRPERGRFLHVDQLGVAQTLLAWTRTSTFEPAARTLLAPLGPLDGDLVRTLAAYLDTGSSVVETAAVLGVHRNTVAARTARIEQLLNVDLADRDQRLSLHLACRAVLG